MKYFSQAAENNKQPILDVLCEVLAEPARVVEIGSGSGQHAIFFGEALPHIVWQPTECADVLSALRANLAEAALANVEAAVELDLQRPDWPVEAPDAVFSANVMHIVRPDLGKALIQGAGQRLAAQGKLLLYGPYKYGGEFTTPSNARFDEWLRSRDPDSGIRDIEWVKEIASDVGLALVGDRQMPANNQLLVLEKR